VEVALPAPPKGNALSLPNSLFKHLNSMAFASTPTLFEKNENVGNFVKLI
jgi:hypothetical protein